MSDSATPKKQRRWQLHLSTMVLLSLLIGALLGLNLRGPHVSSEYVDGRNQKIVVVNAKGWPVPREYVTYAKLDPAEALMRYRQGRVFQDDGAIETGHWRLLFPAWPVCMDNIAVGLIVIAITTSFLERRARRREGRKT